MSAVQLVTEMRHLVRDTFGGAKLLRYFNTWRYR
jgi:hypothetical protein